MRDQIKEKKACEWCGKVRTVTVTDWSYGQGTQLSWKKLCGTCDLLERAQYYARISASWRKRYEEALVKDAARKES